MKLQVSAFCLFCGKVADSKDHVPPRILLERPFPDNLLTIPLCRKCNLSFSLDEEYVLNALVEICDNPILLSKKEVGGTVHRARERSKGLKKRIHDSLIRSEDGKEYFRSEPKRIERVIEKIACGLYFHKYKTIARLEKFKCTGVFPFSVEEMRPADVFLLTYTERFRSKRWTTIQKNVFSYIVVNDWRMSNKLSMFFNMYNSVWCVIEIPRPNLKKRRTQLGTKRQQMLFS